MEQENNEKQPGKKLFKKGQVANPYGRPVGAPNKITTQMRETMHEIFMNNKDKIQEKLDQLDDPKDWLNFVAKLFPYFMPSLTATKGEITVKHTGAEHLNSEELYQKVLTLKLNSIKQSNPEEYDDTNN
ncbi:hypothetical protein [Pedobacter cryotolerans]|uniref:DUF5681 domain-containing protein n=1 Tax=Pedobacter cryotolerans TaxID=2571270 RepID=A0A4U1C5N1_9SPHI|nr:hypothetical protein [Pedobacter cryotolerans]TKC01242.1 hypothetical protein FA045_08330 [Pedobacter cryotolerans]